MRRMWSLTSVGFLLDLATSQAKPQHSEGKFLQEKKIVVLYCRLSFYIYVLFVSIFFVSLSASLLQTIFLHTLYCVYREQCPILYSRLLYKMGNYFLGFQYVCLYMQRGHTNGHVRRIKPCFCGQSIVNFILIIKKETH